VAKPGRIAHFSWGSDTVWFAVKGIVGIRRPEESVTDRGLRIKIVIAYLFE
jgi:hypothetical protein